MSLHSWLSTGLVDRIGWTLLHSLWEGAVIAAVMAVALSLLGKRSAEVRYSASLLAMALMLVAFAVTSAIAPAAELPRASQDTAGSSAVSDQPSSASNDHRNGDTIAAVPTESVAAQLSPQATWRNVASHWFALAWFVGVVLLGGWHTVGWLSVQRLRGIETQTADPSILQFAERIARQLNLSQPFGILLSHFVPTPIVIGWLRPVILIPAGIMTGLTPSQLEGILAHELAHIRRHDYLVNLLQVLAETLLFYHPAVWWLSRQIRLEREQACDDVALSLCSDRCEYASSLAALEALRFAPALAARGSGGRELIARIRRILGSKEASPRYGLAGVLSLLLIAGTAVVLHSQANDNHPAATTTQPFGLKNNTARLSPFTAVRWRINVPEAEFKGTWYEINSINDIPASKILDYLTSSHDFAPKKHFAEDLVEVLTAMGNPPGKTVKLDLKTPDGKTSLHVSNAEMTEENRSSVLKYDSEHPAAAATQPAAPTTDLFKFEEPFKRGATTFLNGDSITITSVKGTNPDMESGICCISGTYTLASHGKAILAASITASDATDGVGPWNSSQTLEIQKGKGEFTLLLPISFKGWPHVSFYGDDDSEVEQSDQTKIAYVQRDLANWKNILTAAQKKLDRLAEKFGTADLGPRDQALQAQLRTQEAQLQKLQIAQDAVDRAKVGHASTRPTVEDRTDQIAAMRRAVAETRDIAREVGEQRNKIESTRSEMAAVQSKITAETRLLGTLSLHSNELARDPMKTSFGGVYIGIGEWVLHH